MALDPRVLQQLRATQAQLDRDGKLFSRAKLTQFYDTFRRAFGPDVLARLDGPALLNKIHNHNSKDSLVYWLEFKDDEEFPSDFGSIAGGSALKFGIYRRRETGAWTTGSSMNQREISEEEAVTRARSHRDQLLRGVALLDRLPVGASDDEYLVLQQRMEQQAPDVGDSSWGHKYFSLLYPEKLDDYHNPDYQRFHLIKLLQVPPVGEGRYLAAGRYVALGAELGLPLNAITGILNERDGDPHRCWRVGTSDGEVSHWGQMRDGAFVAIGWKGLGDLSAIHRDRESKDRLRALFHECYPNTPPAEGNLTQQIFNFLAAVEVSDLVVAADGQDVRGIGRVTGTYGYDPRQPFPHLRPVQWLSITPWQMKEGLRSTVRELRHDPALLVDIERRVLDGAISTGGPVTGGTAALPALSGVAGQIEAALQRKGQVILYGPPGTGKTHHAEQAARDLAAHSRHGRPFAQLTGPEQDELIGPAGLVRFCCFHPAYGYEDFLEGYRPEPPSPGGAQVAFRLRDGIFKRLCREAAAQRGQAAASI